MLPIQSIAKSAAAIALGLASLGAFGASAFADDSHLVGVKSMDVMAHGPAPVVTVRNVAANHSLASLKLAVQENQIALSIGGYVECLGTTSENLTWRRGHFLRDGAFGIGRTGLVHSKALPESSSIDHVQDMDAHGFQLPVAQLTHPQIGIDPVAVVLRHADEAPDRLQYLRQNHVIMEQIPIRWESTCAYYERNKISKDTFYEAQQPLSHVVKYTTLKIVYQGDPQLFEVNAQIGQGQLPGSFQAGPQPLQITSAQFQHDMPHHEGACPATKQVRVFYQGQGQGELRIRLSAGNTPLQESGVIAYDSKNHTQNYVFELETPKGAALNNTIMHNLRVFVVTRSAGEQGWSNNYQLMDQAVWKTRCTPVVNPVLGGGGAGGKVGGFQNGGANQAPTPGLQLRQPQPGEPATPAIRRVP
ncbi:MAG: hypothetical protein ACFCUW_08760 [Kiloniellaceae bacterium]